MGVCGQFPSYTLILERWRKNAGRKITYKSGAGNPTQKPAFFRFAQGLKLTSLTLAQTGVKITRFARNSSNLKTLAARQPPERVRRAFKMLVIS
jgi:hypothetical protein